MIVDLHCHSTNSDGTKTIEEILTMAQEANIHTLAITDHENLKGAKEAYAVNQKKRIYSGNLIAGIEISVYIGVQNVHLLAYFPSLNIDSNSNLIITLNRIQQSRVGRMKEMVKKANDMGLEISYSEILEEVRLSDTGVDQPTDVISRPHMARVFLKKGYVTSTNEAFVKYLEKGKLLYVPRFRLSIEEIIDEVKKERGIVIWAHPLVGRNNDIETLKSVAEIVISSGICGMELVYDYESKYPVPKTFVQEGSKLLWDIVDNHEFLVTAGGDYHGDVGILGKLELDKVNLLKFVSKLKLLNFNL